MKNLNGNDFVMINVGAVYTYSLFVLKGGTNET